MPAPVDLTRLRQEGVVKEASRHYVVDDLEPLGEVSGPRYEIIDGELYMSPVPKRRHQIIVGRIHELLLELVKSTGRGTIYLAPVGVVLAPDRLVSPDIVVLRPESERAIPADEAPVTEYPLRNRLTQPFFLVMVGSFGHDSPCRGDCEFWIEHMYQVEGDR
jgi:hypothetical protein